MAGKPLTAISDMADRLSEKRANVIYTGNHLTELTIPRLPSGVFIFDYLTQGGIPKGRLTMFHGVKSCVDKDTEFLTPIGWKKISEYEVGDKVGQYTSDGMMEFVTPNKYIKNSSDYLWHFKSKVSTGLDMVVSDNHNVVWITSRGKLKKDTFSYVRKMHKSSKYGFAGKIPSTFIPVIHNSLSISDDALRLLVAIIADGHFPNNKNGVIRKTNYCIIRLKKNHKKERLRKLLELANISFSEKKILEESPRLDKGFSIFTFYAPMHIKEFSEYFWGCSLHQLNLISEEVLYWDGSLKYQSFFTTKKQSADFVQYAFIASGYSATMYIDDRVDKPITYTVHRIKKKTISMRAGGGQEYKATINKVKSIDGFQYCFSVPSGMLVLRRNNNVFITGNSGKSTHAMRIAGSYQQIEPTKNVLFVDFEHSYDHDWARNFIPNLDKFYLLSPDYGEQGIDMLVELIKAEDVGLVIVDSLAMIIPTAEATASATDDFVGLQARLINKMLRRIIPTISQRRAEGNPVTVLLVNQIRSNIGARSFQPAVSKPGGHMVEHVVSMDIRFYTKAYEKSADKTVRCIHMFNIEKNKVGLPKLSGEYKTYLAKTKEHNIGDVVDYETVFDIGKRQGVISRNGNKWIAGTSAFANQVALTTALAEDPDFYNGMKQLILKNASVEEASDESTDVESDEV